MSMSSTSRRGRHVVFQMHVHLVFVTKYRRACFSKKGLDFLNLTFSKICSKFDATLIEFNGEADHVHLLVYYPPKVTISKLVNSLKGVSSRLFRKAFRKEISRYYWKGVLWSPSYFAGSCGGAPIETLMAYIRKQVAPA
jgi:putative transposase